MFASRSLGLEASQCEEVVSLECKQGLALDHQGFEQIRSLATPFSYYRASLPRLAGIHQAHNPHLPHKLSSHHLALNLI